MASEPESPKGERIAKVVARAGLGSRRDVERWIADGRVAVDGKVLTTPAFIVTPENRVTVDGRDLPAAERARLFRFHKPRGMLTTAHDPQGRPTIYDGMPPGLPRLMPVGRLDFNSEGLLLLTNDGGLKRHLELPTTGWVRRYRARVHGRPDAVMLARLKHGITIDDVRYGPIEAEAERQQGSNCWLTVALSEGKNREVRRVLEHLGLPVNRLIRVAYGPFSLGDLPPAACIEVPGKMLRDQMGSLLDAKTAERAAPPPRPHRAKR
jgi:23S rRNA pseudouridine2605 synthase